MLNINTNANASLAVLVQSSGEDTFSFQYFPSLKSWMQNRYIINKYVSGVIINISVLYYGIIINPLCFQAGLPV